MATKNIRFKDKSGNILYPQTKASNILDANGEPIDIGSFITATQLQEAIAEIDSIRIIPVTTLPEISDAEPRAIYFLTATNGENKNLFLEYMVINGAWELIGSAGINLDGYVTSAELEASYYDKETVDEKLSEVSGDVTFEEI